MKYCSKCGSEFNAGSKFCDQCGHQPENLNKENEVHAQAETTPVKVYEKTKKTVLSKSKIMKKIIAIAFTLSTLTIALGSFYFVIKSKTYDRGGITDAIYPHTDFNYEEELTSLFPHWPHEFDLDGADGDDFQNINYKVSIHRDDFLKEIDKLFELHRDYIRACKDSKSDFIWEIYELEEAIEYGLLPLSSIMFLMSLYLLVISFKETK